jgi:hypothetical protein
MIEGLAVSQQELRSRELIICILLFRRRTSPYVTLGGGALDSSSEAPVIQGVSKLPGARWHVSSLLRMWNGLPRKTRCEDYLVNQWISETESAVMNMKCFRRPHKSQKNLLPMFSACAHLLSVPNPTHSLNLPSYKSHYPCLLLQLKLTDSLPSCT